MVFTDLVLLVFGIIIIYKASEWMIIYSLSLAKIMGVSTFVIGFILVAISTSLPEIFVTVFAVLQDETNLAIGNILGSNLFDINVIIGLTTVLIGTIYMKREETLHLVELLFITSVVTMIILSLPSLSAIHGFVLLILFGYMIIKLYKGGRVPPELFDEPERPHLIKKNRILDFFRKNTLPVIYVKFFFSLTLLLVGTYLLVNASIALAGEIGLSTFFIGATVVAFGTSIPELAVTFAAVRKKQYALAMGNVIGSAVTNITLVLGILSLLSTSPLDPTSIAGLLPFLVVSTMYLWFRLSKNAKVTKFDGIILLALYATFLLEQLGILLIFA